MREFVAVLSLVDFSILKQTRHYSSADSSAVAATIFLALFLGVETGVAAGVAIFILLHFYKTSHPHVVEFGLLTGTQHFRNIKRHAVEISPAFVTLRVDESLYFANARFLEDLIQSSVTAGCAIRDVVLMFFAVNEVDYSALESLKAINARLRNMDVGIHFPEVKGKVMDQLDKSHFMRELNGEVFLSQFDAWTNLTHLRA